MPLFLFSRLTAVKKDIFKSIVIVALPQFKKFRKNCIEVDVLNIEMNFPFVLTEVQT